METTESPPALPVFTGHSGWTAQWPTWLFNFRVINVGNCVQAAVNCWAMKRVGDL